jgi:hypothetical protein
MSPDDFRLALFSMIQNGELPLGYLAKEGLAQKLHVIFDIDHTLIHSVSDL